jgi:5-methylcytosine-specific restriction protein A
MNVFVLTHNPDMSGSPSEQPGWAERTAAGTRIRNENWSTGSRRTGLHDDDVGFVLRTKDRRGIIAACEFTGEIYQDDHWQDRELPKRQRRQANYAPCDFVRVVAVEDRLPIDELRRRFSAVAWDRFQGSGVMLAPNVGRRLRRLWDEHVALLNGGPYLPDEADEAETFNEEGHRLVVSVTRFERNPRARKACIDHHGYACAGCDLELETVYGPRGRHFIHVHHLDPIASATGPRKVDPVRDLRPLCPNCHAIVHRYRPILTLSQLRALVRRNRATEGSG